MKILLTGLLLLSFILRTAAAGDEAQTAQTSAQSCTSEWYQNIENIVATGDGQGHGPDAGSGEWQSVVEFRLGVRGNPAVPPRNSEEWCRYIDRLLSERPRQQEIANSGPSFDCAAVETGSTEALICADRELMAMDMQLAGVYADARDRATNEHPPVLQAEQRGWIKSRNECWKNDDRRQCVEDAYVTRITELQARYRLVGSNGPFRFVCDGNPANEVTVTFFATEPRTLIAERGDSVSLMYVQPSGSGAKYQGPNESFWEHHGEAVIVWGYGAPEMRCEKN